MLIRKAALTVMMALALASAYATDSATENDEGPFVGGVFFRLPGAAIEPSSQDEEEPGSPLIFDDEGNSNRVIILLDVDDVNVLRAIIGKGLLPTSRGKAEEAIVRAVNNDNGTAKRYFSGADGARHAIRENRLDNETRSRMRDDDPEERLQQFILLHYPSVEAAKEAQAHLETQPGVLLAAVDVRMQLLWVPNDPYFAINAQSAARYQWGMHAMNFAAAWDRTKGHGYVGAVDSGLLNDVPPSDLAGNHRAQFSFFSSFDSNDWNRSLEYHGAHVLGIIAATARNSTGVAGGCPTCSVSIARWNGTTADSGAAISSMIDRGMQIINLSFGRQSSCTDSTMAIVCNAIAKADSKDVLLVAAAGNISSTVTQFPANHGSPLAVGGAMNTNPGVPSQWAFWTTPYRDGNNNLIGSNYPGVSGVVAPAASIVSTVYPSMIYNSQAGVRCADVYPGDESGVDGDGYGTCSGTSMAAPHVSALAGILRSINPRLSTGAIKSIIRTSGSNSGSPTAQLGYGLPNARIAVDQAIAQTPNRLTPLFSMYSSGRRDYFYTTVPQMGAAASLGTLQPVNTVGTGSRYASSGGNSVSGNTVFPGGYPSTIPVAAAWIFTTPDNPKNAAIPLVPLYRLSWKCGDPTPYPPTICSSVPNHADVTYTADINGVTAFESSGYKLDGIEGYIYPKTISQPTGTVRFMRKYNPARDDHAIFPETMLSTMTSQGYTENSGSDWLGYVYPNLTGNTPSIN